MTLAEFLRRAAARLNTVADRLDPPREPPAPGRVGEVRLTAAARRVLAEHPEIMRDILGDSEPLEGSLEARRRSARA